MRFRFNGGLDCPDWVLAQIAAFTEIPANNFQSLCIAVEQHLRSKSTDWTESELAALGLSEITDIRLLKGCIAALSFVIEKASKYECSPGDLEKEMLQLGMFTEHAKELREIYATFWTELHAILIQRFERESSFTVTGTSEQQIGAVCVKKLQVRTSNGRQMQLAVEQGQLEQLKQELLLALSTLNELGVPGQDVS